MTEPNQNTDLKPLESQNETLRPLTFREAKEFKEEQIWRSLFSIPLSKAVEHWLNMFDNLGSRRTYASIMNELIRRGLLNPHMSLQEFSLMNFESFIDNLKKAPLVTERVVKGIKTAKPWSEANRQRYAAAFISFTGFLARRTGGLIRKAVPSKEGHNKTFYRVRDKVKTQAFEERADWERFFIELHEINPRDCLLAKLMLQGGKRINEVLALMTDAINYVRGEITYVQSKTKGTSSYTVISYRQEIFNELKTYIGNREGYVFVTRNLKPVRYRQIQRNFKLAGERSLIPFRVTPHVLRATAVTQLKASRMSDTDIMKVTGHANSQMIAMYDKSAKADNASKKVNLV